MHLSQEQKDKLTEILTKNSEIGEINKLILIFLISLISISSDLLQPALEIISQSFLVDDEAMEIDELENKAILRYLMLLHALSEDYSLHVLELLIEDHNPFYDVGFSYWIACSTDIAEIGVCYLALLDNIAKNNSNEVIILLNNPINKDLNFGQTIATNRDLHLPYSEKIFHSENKKIIDKYLELLNKLTIYSPDKKIKINKLEGQLLTNYSVPVDTITELLTSVSLSRSTTPSISSHFSQDRSNERVVDSNTRRRRRISVSSIEIANKNYNEFLNVITEYLNQLGTEERCTPSDKLIAEYPDDKDALGAAFVTHFSNKDPKIITINVYEAITCSDASFSAKQRIIDFFNTKIVQFSIIGCNIKDVFYDIEQDFVDDFYSATAHTPLISRFCRK